MKKFKKSYNYIWAYTDLNNLDSLDNLNNSNNSNNSKDLNDSDKKIKFYIAKKKNPYIEVNEEFLNGNGIENKNGAENDFLQIPINPYIRFFNIFSVYDEIDEKQLSDAERIIKKNIENKIILLLREIDFINGTTIVDIICESIKEDIENKIFGEKLKKLFHNLNNEDKDKIALLIYKSMLISTQSLNNEKEKLYFQENLKFFIAGIKYFFSNCIIYLRKNKKNQIVIFLNYKKAKKFLNIVKILEYLFLPFEVKVQYFWENHFGVIGVKDTIKVEENGVF